MRKIPITIPFIDSKDIKKVALAVKYGWGDNAFKNIKEFENKFKRNYKFNYVSAVSSCTGALHLSLKALNIKRGDEIILPDATWISCANAISYVGAKPVFADIKMDTYCIDPESVKKKITKKTKAIMAVHLYGNVCDLDQLIKISKKNNLYLIEDCAEAIGAKYKNKNVGSFGDVSVFSFHGTKTITTGEGGMFVCKKKKIFNNFQLYHNMGKNPKESKYFFLEVIGLKYKISNIQAALGVSQLDKIKHILKNKERVFNLYKKYFSSNNFRLNVSEHNSKSTYWMTTLTILQKQYKRNFKERLIKFCMKKNIHLRPFFYPITSMSMYKTNYINKNSRILSISSVNLPSGYNTSYNDIKRIYKTINEFLVLEKKK